LPRLRYLLPQVQKPACYGVCEQGMQTPNQSARMVSGLLTSPDTDEIALPNQGSQVRNIADLATQPRGLQESELVTAHGTPMLAHRVGRLHQWTPNENDYQQCSDPLSTAASALLRVT